MSRLAPIPKILEKLGSPTLLARRDMARARGHGRTVGSLCGAANTKKLQPSITKAKRESGMLVALSSMGKLGLHLGVNELLNKSTISQSHAGTNGPLQLTEDEITHINLPLTTRLAPIKEVDMIATNVRSVPLLQTKFSWKILARALKEYYMPEIAGGSATRSEVG
jgi:hypothetical protein